MADDKAPGLPTIDVNEYGGKKDGERQVANRRLFMQLVVFDLPASEAESAPRAVAHALEERKIPAVLYADCNDPRGAGLLTWSEDPAHFVTRVRPLFATLLARAAVRQDWTMLGRTYATGHEPDLLDSLLARPVRNALNPAHPWHVWYPLRRSGAFSRLDPQGAAEILREHAVIGHAYGKQDLAHDIRLACHGLDAKDNEFVLGLVSRELHPLSHLVQAMRKTKQTSEYIEQMGPFFVGHVTHRVTG
ncbi:MAG TPA: chlorite dismutase family protein [Polyangiaceae bacterium]|jgi:chlorite dismutase